MKVIAKKGARCPREGRPREYITDAGAVDVPDSAYYRRLIREGSLVLADTETHSLPGAGKNTKTLNHTFADSFIPEKEG